MSFVPKPNGQVRSVVDLVQLNKFVDRPTHPFPAPKDIIASIPKGSKCFAVFDAANGYWQIPLEEESRPYTCFMTEWGRFQYKRAPMGLVSSGDEFCARTDSLQTGRRYTGLWGNPRRAPSPHQTGVRVVPGMGYHTIQEEISGRTGRPVCWIRCK